MTLNLDEFVKCGGKIPGQQKRGSLQTVVDSYVCKVLGVLDTVPNTELRRQIIKKTLRILNTR